MPYFLIHPRGAVELASPTKESACIEAFAEIVKEYGLTTELNYKVVEAASVGNMNSGFYELVQSFEILNRDLVEPMVLGVSE